MTSRSNLNRCKKRTNFDAMDENSRRNNQRNHRRNPGVERPTAMSPAKPAILRKSARGLFAYPANIQAIAHRPRPRGCRYASGSRK